MKIITRLTAIAIAGVVICYFGLSGYVWYHDNQRSKQADVQASTLEENNKVLGFLREKGCDYCHTPSAELPFYSSFPVAKQLMNYDIQLGYKSFNLEAVRAALVADKPVSQSDLNKIEWVMQYDTMPPTRYTALHWAGKVSDTERAEILGWIAKQREQYYASNDTAAQHRNEPVQPIPESIPTDARKVALGFTLYHDPRISGDSTISCAHCHALNAGGVDGRKTSIGVGGAVGPINAPTVFNSVFNVEQFWDGRAPTLQAQAGGVARQRAARRARGHRHVAYLGARLDERTIIKQKGYEQAMLDAGMTPYSVMVEQSSSYSSGIELMRQARREYPQLDGIFCTNDDLAVGAAFECQRLGLKIPDDMAIAGFHGHDIGQVMEPRLASVLTPRERMGRIGAERLLARIRGEAITPKMLDLGFTLSPGGSI